MLVKVILLFLLAMAVLALFGRLRFPAALRRRMGGRPAKCPKCGQYIIGNGCNCGGPAARKG